MPLEFKVNLIFHQANKYWVLILNLELHNTNLKLGSFLKEGAHSYYLVNESEFFVANAN